MFIVFDMFEDQDCLGIFNTKADAKKCVRQREKDTGGECYCVIYSTERNFEENEDGQHYGN